MYDLATAPPHLPPHARFDAVSYAVYCQGYMMALTRALQVMEFAGERWRLSMDVIFGPPTTPVRQVRVVIDDARSPILIALASLPDEAFLYVMADLDLAKSNWRFLTEDSRRKLRILYQKTSEFAQLLQGERGVVQGERK